MYIQYVPLSCGLRVEAGKAGINFRKHGIRMPEAIPVFEDPYAITITDDESVSG